MPTGRLLVVCKRDQALDVIDLDSGAVGGRVTASAFTPHEVVGTPDGRRAYLPIYSDVFLGESGTDGRAVDVIDLVDLRLEHTIPLDFASRPHLPALGPDARMYVGTELDESVSVLDPSTGARVARLPTGRPQSHMFVLSPDGSRAYSANVDTGTVSVMDVASESLVAVVEVTDRVQRISITPDGRTVFTADQRHPRVAAIDSETLAVTWIAVPSVAFGTAVTQDGRSLILALRSASQLAVLDLADHTLPLILDVPPKPQNVVMHPDGEHAYTACDQANVVVEIDLRRGVISRTFATGQQPDGLAWVPSPAG